MTADEARELTKQYIDMAEEDEYEGVLTAIENAAKDGVYSVNFDMWSKSNIKKLKTLGYNVSTPSKIDDCEIPGVTRTISWE